MQKHIKKLEEPLTHQKLNQNN